uniref:Uncharacterized protein n=1 Tax=Ditylenchus dipsaci TaxID=166011 RepID=A0A915CUR3_9BILA
MVVGPDAAAVTFGFAVVVPFIIGSIVVTPAALFAIEALDGITIGVELLAGMILPDTGAPAKIIGAAVILTLLATVNRLVGVFLRDVFFFQQAKFAQSLRRSSLNRLISNALEQKNMTIVLFMATSLKNKSALIHSFILSPSSKVY